MSILGLSKEKLDFIYRNREIQKDINIGIITMIIISIVLIIVGVIMDYNIITK